MLNFQSICFGQRHSNFTYSDMELIRCISRLARQHQQQCENYCNGYGKVAGKMYYTGAIDDYARRKYGANVQDGNPNNADINVFDCAAGKIEDKINGLIKADLRYRVQYQRDPRGATIRLYYEREYIEL